MNKEASNVNYLDSSQPEDDLSTSEVSFFNLEAVKRQGERLRSFGTVAFRLAALEQAAADDHEQRRMDTL